MAVTSHADSGWNSLPESYAIPEQAPSLPEARAYCERLARNHYENFTVGSWFLPKRLRPHFFAVYAYCRISDDLGDEVGNPAQSLALLGEWERELDACYDGSPRHPVFVALAETVRDCEIPKQPFVDLLTAFRQDQIVSRYETFDELLGYCRYSANPVGRLVLYLCGYRDQERQQLSDHTCTALQLANFWQDVKVDLGKGRIYLPLEDMRRFHVGVGLLRQPEAAASVRELLRFEVERARTWFENGLPLIEKVDRELATDIELFSRGGQAILDAIERQDFDVLRRRPALTKFQKASLVMKASLRKLA
jgi:squalene synthase HpnC